MAKSKEILELREVFKDSPKDDTKVAELISKIGQEALIAEFSSSSGLLHDIISNGYLKNFSHEALNTIPIEMLLAPLDLYDRYHDGYSPLMRAISERCLKDFGAPVLGKLTLEMLLIEDSYGRTLLTMSIGRCLQDFPSGLLSQLTTEILLPTDANLQSPLSLAISNFDGSCLKDFGPQVLGKFTPEMLLTKGGYGRTILKMAIDGRCLKDFGFEMLSKFTRKVTLELGIEEFWVHHIKAGQIESLLEAPVEGVIEVSDPQAIYNNTVQTNLNKMNSQAFALFKQPAIYEVIPGTLRDIADKFLAENFFKIIGVCQNFATYFNLPKEIVANITGYLDVKVYSNFIEHTGETSVVEATEMYPAQ